MIDIFLLGKIINFKTEDKDITQEKLAEKCNTTQFTISTYLTWYYQLIKNFSFDEQFLFLSTCKLITLRKHPEYQQDVTKEEIEIISKNLDLYFLNKQKKQKDGK